MTDEFPPLNWTPKGERRNQLQDLAALSMLAEIGQPPTLEELNKARLRYLGKYLEFGGDDQEVLAFLNEEWTPQDLQQRFGTLNGKI